MLLISFVPEDVKKFLINCRLNNQRKGNNKITIKTHLKNQEYENRN